jgi:signal transduction histidine kinase
MLAIGSSKTNQLLLGGWMAVAAISVLLMYLLPGAETIPFHVVWIGLSVIYGFTTWRPLGMVLILLAVATSTGHALAHHAQLGVIGWQEVTEVPLMAAVFGVMVWHVHRRQVALAQVARLAETQRRLADAERRRAERQGTFVRLASHELRTPITIARGYTEMVHGASPPALQADTAIVLEELDKLARITQRLVTLMQMDGAYTRQLLDVDAALTRIVRRWERAADRTWRVHSTIGTAMVNPERLEVALDCLLDNATKFTRPGDLVSVTGRGRGESWIVEVADSGVGMTTERARALTAGDVPLERSANGSGLGLAITRAVVESWGGQITVAGQPEAGTTVTLSFPDRGRDSAIGDIATAVPVTA